MRRKLPTVTRPQLSKDTLNYAGQYMYQWLKYENSELCPTPKIRVYTFRNMNRRYYPEYIPRVSLCNEKCVFSVTQEINF